MFFCGREKPGCTVNTIAVAQGHGGETLFGRTFGQVLRQGCASEEAEGTAGVEFDVGHGSSRVNSIEVPPVFDMNQAVKTLIGRDVPFFPLPLPVFPPVAIQKPGAAHILDRPRAPR